MLILFLAIGAGMGVTAFVKKSFRDISFEQASPPLSGTRKPERELRRIADDEHEQDSQPSATTSVKTEEPAAVVPRAPSPKPKVAIVPPKAPVTRPKAVVPPIKIQPAALRPQTLAAPAPQVQSPPREVSTPVTRVSTIVVQRVVAPRPANPPAQPMEDLSESMPQPTESIEEEKDLVFEDISAPLIDQETPKPARMERERPKKSKKAVVQNHSTKSSAGHQSFRDRLKKSRDDIAEEAPASQAATRSFQDRLRKSVK